MKNSPYIKKNIVSKQFKQEVQQLSAMKNIDPELVLQQTTGRDGDQSGQNQQVSEATMYNYLGNRPLQSARKSSRKNILPQSAKKNAVPNS